MRFLPTGVARPVLSSSPFASSSFAFLRFLWGFVIASADGAGWSGSASSPPRRMLGFEKGIWESEGPGLETPMPRTPLPMPENIRPNSLLIPGWPPGPDMMGCDPCGGCGIGDNRPLRLISGIPSNPLGGPAWVGPSSIGRGRPVSKATPPGLPLYATDRGGGPSSPGRPPDGTPRCGGGGCCGC